MALQSFGTSQIVTETKLPILVSLPLLLWKLQTFAWSSMSNYPVLPKIGLILLTNRIQTDNMKVWVVRENKQSTVKVNECELLDHF